MIYLRKTAKIICVAAVAAIVLAIAGIYLFAKENDPAQYLRIEYKNKPGYSIQLQKSNRHYTGFLGDDKNNFYLDLFEDGKYFGRSEGPINGIEPISVYQFQQYETLVVIFGVNPDLKYRSYSLTVGSTTVKPMTAKKDISKDKYILDIYVLDKKYNGTADLEFSK